MFYENSTSEILKCAEQEENHCAYHIHNGLLYHYTKLDTLWKILESDSLFARNIRFSNDFNEYLTGRDTIEKFVRGLKDLNSSQRNEILKKVQENPMMYFMVCFCEDGDLLSQWRGYAQNGVSIGMDFTGGICETGNLSQHVEWFCVLNNKKYQDATGKKTDGKYYIENEPTIFLQMPYKVQYVSKERSWRDKDNKNVKMILNELYENSEDGQDRLLGYIPYIKDKGFREEEEYRLIYDMEFLGQSEAHSESVRSKKLEFLEQDNLKKPYINVEFGKPKNKESKVKTVWLGGEAKVLRDEIVAQYRSLKICFADKTEVYIDEGNNQEEIQETIEKLIEGSVKFREKEPIKIWCRGHLPIRKIIVGPGERQDEIKECLEFFKKTIYWLKYVDIDVSITPLRI